ncbi:hypothetical protein ACWGKW_41390 [Streptomyces sp. NPDC054766]
MSESDTVDAAERPIPRDRPDQQATKSDPLDIDTMVCHARRSAARRQTREQLRPGQSR